jgi:phosphatidylglycerophosphate synthase
LRAFWPAIAVIAYLAIGYMVFMLRCARRGAPQQWHDEARGRSALVGTHVRVFFFWVTEPLWRALLASGLSANAVTGLAAALGLGAALAAAAGRLGLAGWSFLLSGILDVMDGRLARARGEASAAGAAIDSILDRYTDALVLVGLGLYYRESWVLLAVLLALVGTSAVPYVRAKSEALGFPVGGGLMQRAERILYLGASMALAPLVDAVWPPSGARPRFVLAAAGVVFVALTSNVTALGRFLRLVRAMGGPGGHAVRPQQAG